MTLLWVTSADKYCGYVISQLWFLKEEMFILGSKCSQSPIHPTTLPSTSFPGPFQLIGRRAGGGGGGGEGVEGPFPAPPQAREKALGTRLHQRDFRGELNPIVSVIKINKLLIKKINRVEF